MKRYDSLGRVTFYSGLLKRFSLLMGLILILLLSEPAAVSSAAAPALQLSDTSWTAAYWNNTVLAGPPNLQRTETNLDHNWGNGSPDPAINRDGFSARWARYINVEAGTYGFRVTSDDGVRVWIGNELIIDAWNDQSATTYTATRNLNAGLHLVTVEYYEDKGSALIQFAWAPVSAPTYEWRGEYFNNPYLSGNPALVRNDPKIDFNWGRGSPAPGIIDSDYFSVRWTRTVNLAAGNYRFALTVDDGGRLWVNDRLLIDAWQIQSPHTYVVETPIPGGDTTIRVEYFDYTEGAVAKLDARGINTPGPSTYVPDWNNVLPRNWPSRMPSRWHEPIRACLAYFNQIQRPLESPPNWSAILRDCVGYLDSTNGQNNSELNRLAPLLAPQ